MRSRLAISLLLGATAAVSACGGSSGDPAADPTIADDAIGDAAVAAVTAPSVPDAVGSIGDAVEVMAGAPGQANDAACELDRQTLATAEEIFVTMNARMPANQAELVEQLLIKEPSPRYEITAEGQIVPAPGSPCL